MWTTLTSYINNASSFHYKESSEGGVFTPSAILGPPGRASMLALRARGYGHHLGHRTDTIPQEKAEGDGE